jgi:hypothetical protein
MLAYGFINGFPSGPSIIEGVPVDAGAEDGAEGVGIDALACEVGRLPYC